ncbi:cupredoxin domain-containing protein [Modestobacter sp. VKM Ac-2983]|uniref:cupredoxin domain-containing protein n=1 Tax=Modestobacter sp. VKM Ac-2983 TaxID=3004137 RepID=UPI0022AB7368|nr:cupredoxin domain-containing protein [Modestobacter sp. VKM Ac-2983]MCZ2805577.1 cupredoxin domain-containing protein [Modestobacter sp. VKM Ac-2983]
MPITSPSRSASTRAVLHRRVARPAAALTLAVTVAALSSCSADSDAPASAAPTATAEQPETSTAEQSETAPEGSDAGSATPASVGGDLSASLVDFAVELPDQELEAGSYTIEVANDGSASHDLVIEDAAGSEVAASEILSPGQSGTIEVDLAPGEYVFYCSVGNHRGMGMELTVTVV